MSALLSRRILSCLALVLIVVLFMFRNFEASLLRPSSSVGQGDTGSLALKQDDRPLLSRADFPDAPVSPYEQRNKRGKKLPKWAQKPFFMRQPANYTGPQVCFVHVGKTAGSTVGCLLGFELHCASRKKMTWDIHEGILPLSAQHTFHNIVNDCPDQQDYYLFVVRDPLTRMQSWFAYERPSTSPTKENEYCEGKRKELFEDCPFPTLNALAEKGLLGYDTEISDECRERARKAMAGERGYCRHNKYNYGYFEKGTPKGGEVLVIRTEHLRDDWNSAEAYLHHASKSTEELYQVSKESFPRHNKSEKSRDDTFLSISARKALCAALCPDIQAYKRILLRAKNLSSEDVDASLIELHRSCPKQARMSSCPVVENDDPVV